MFLKCYKAALLQNCTPVFFKKMFHHNFALKMYIAGTLCLNVPTLLRDNAARIPRPKGLKMLSGNIAGTCCPRVLKMFLLFPQCSRRTFSNHSAVCVPTTFIVTLCDNLIDKVMHSISHPSPDDLPELCV